MGWNSAALDWNHTAVGAMKDQPGKELWGTVPAET
jgi:hypothetical protein